MKNIAKNIVIKLLALAAVILPMEKVRGQDAEKIEPKASLGLFNSIEQEGSKPMYAETCLNPSVSLQKGEHNLKYEGHFWRFGYTNGEICDWWRLSSYLSYENADWDISIGRRLIRKYAGYAFTPATPRFDNLSTANGDGMLFAGLYAEHKPTGLGVGYVADNNQVGPKNWDTGLLTWSKEFGKDFAFQAHIGATKREVTRAGLTAKWTPTDKATVIGEAIYKGQQTTTFLTTHYYLTDTLRVYGGVQTTFPNSGKMTGLISTGLDYQVPKSGVHFFAGIHQDLGGKKETSFVAGMRFNSLIEAAKGVVNYRGL